MTLVMMRSKHTWSWAASLVFLAENALTQDRNPLQSQSIDAVELREMSRP